MNLTKIDSLTPNNPARIFYIFLLGVFICCNISFGQQDVRDSLLTLIKQKESQHKDTTYINLLNDLGVKFRFYKTDSLLMFSKLALEHSDVIDYDKGRIEAFHNFASYHSSKGDHLKAIENFEMAIESAAQNNLKKLELRGMNGLATQYEYIEETAKALSTYLKGKEIADKIGDMEMQGVFNLNLGFIYDNQKDYEEALLYYKAAKKIAKEINNNIYMGYSLSNIASTYANMGNLDYAMFNVNKSIEIFEKEERMDWLAFAYEVKGRTYLEQEKYKWALFWFNQSQTLHDKHIEDEKGKIFLLNGIAGANMGLKMDDVAMENALEALEISNRHKDNSGIKKSTKILYEVLKKRKQYDEALKYHELYQKTTDEIFKRNNKKNLLMLKVKTNHEQQKKDLIATNEKALAKQKNYMYASLAILLILMTITLFVRRSERIQKNLNKELNSKKTDLEKNEVELKAINETKDKMFSIIGHDLRGPIGAFQGLLQLLKNGEINQTEFLQFVPKLRTDIDNISFTLNNLLSWGQTQMNGTITQPTVVSLENLVMDNVNLLSEIADNKSIKMISQLAENTLAWTDADQIDIVIRNLMSNALKFTPKNGMVTVNAQEKSDHWEVSVRDTGVGMDEETKNKIFAKNSNVTTYGTDNEKGTGLGLSLCKEMVENNKGTIWVESVLRKGTCFYFTVPKAKKKLQKAS